MAEPGPDNPPDAPPSAVELAARIAGGVLALPILGLRLVVLGFGGRGQRPEGSDEPSAETGSDVPALPPGAAPRPAVVAPVLATQRDDAPPRDVVEAALRDLAAASLSSPRTRRRRPAGRLE